MNCFRVKLGYKNRWFVLSQPKLNEKNKQELFKLLKAEFGLSRIYIRRNSVICVE